MVRPSGTGRADAFASAAADALAALKSPPPIATPTAPTATARVWNVSSAWCGSGRQ